MEVRTADWSAGQAYHFMASAVAPRPIAWVTTVSKDGVTNAAPFSWFQAVCADPPMIMLSIADRSDGSPKDTLKNIQETGELVVNAASEAMLEQMVATSADLAPDASELDAAHLATQPAQSVAPPRITGAPFHLECKLVDVHRYGRSSCTNVVSAEVIHVRADDDLLDERGNFKPHEAHLLARLGGADYLAVRDVFAHKRPQAGDKQR